MPPHKGTHAMERESRPSDSDHTMRSVLSPLRPPVPDVGNKTPEEHLTDFFTEYDDHKDFMRARGVHGSARYKALLKLHNKPDAECSDRELRLKKLTKSPQEHLDDFSREYDDHGDFKKARGVDKSARYMALLRLNNKPDYECSERELELKELWEGLKTPQDHLDDFFTEYNDHHGFKKARGVRDSARYRALERLKNKPDGECSERELQLKELWYNPLRTVPRELRDALMDIIKNPETPREEKLAELHRKIIRERREEGEEEETLRA